MSAAHLEAGPALAHPAAPRPLTSSACGALKGRATVPGDKSISHRALMFGALARGETIIDGLLEGEDVLRTAAAMRAMGARVERLADGRWRVVGNGVGGLAEPEDVLDMGNAGTGARLVMGLVAGHAMTAVFTGDASLRRRPMGRVAEPLQRMGAQFHGRAGGRLPLAVTGAATPLAIEYALKVPSAQVKSAVLLAGLTAPGRTTVFEREPTRDHTERMLRHFGAAVEVHHIDPGLAVSIEGFPELEAAPVSVPADPSSAAFPICAALILAGSAVTLTNVGLNPLRTGLIRTLREMGAEIVETDPREEGGEPVADLTVTASRLRGVEVPAERAPSMIDEYPILAAVAACAEGTTVMHGLAELRVKESDRLAGIIEGLTSCGVAARADGDTLIVEGRGRPPEGGGHIATRLDHRIAMAFLVLGMAAERPVTIDDAAAIDTSFPGFVALMNGLGAAIAPMEV